MIKYNIAHDGWADCQHCFEFESDNIKKEKKFIFEYIKCLGRIIDVFTVLDKHNETVFTEEDFE